MMKSKLFLLALLFLIPACASAYLLTDVGVDVKVTATGAAVNGDINISIWNAPAGGNLIFNQNFVGGIVDGAWNEVIDPYLEYGQFYYKDYAVNGEDVDFSGSERLQFQANVGHIANESFINFSVLIDACPAGEAINTINDDGTVVCEAVTGAFDNDSGWWNNSDSTFTYNNVSLLNNNNITASWGFFTFLGSLINKITSIFVDDITVTNNASATYFVGSGKYLTDLMEVNVSKGSYNCSNGYVAQNATINETGVWLDCVLNNQGVTTYYPASTATTGGAVDVDNLTLMYWYEGDTYNITEGNAADPLDVYINFTSVTSFEQLVVREYYDGSASHHIVFQIWNYIDTEWEDYYDIVGQGGFSIIDLPVFDDTDHIGTGGDAGLVQVRLHHVQSGINSHRLYIDFAWLLDNSGTGGTVDLTGYAKYKFDYNNFYGNGSFETTDNISGDYLFSNYLLAHTNNSATIGTHTNYWSTIYADTLNARDNFSIGSTEVTTNGTVLNYLKDAGGTTGTTSKLLVFSTSPVITTPELTGNVTFTTNNGKLYQTAGITHLVGGTNAGDDLLLRSSLSDKKPYIQLYGGGATRIMQGAGTTIVMDFDGTDEYVYNSTALECKANDIYTTGVIKGATLNTGNGAYELYKMDQNVDTAAAPSFAGLTSTSTITNDGNYLNMGLGAAYGKTATVLDDQATSWTPTSTIGIVTIYLRTTSGTFQTCYGQFIYRIVNTEFFTTMIAGSNTVNAGTGTLAGTTGTDGKCSLTADAGTGKIYFENRLGNTVALGYFMMGI